MFLSSLRSQEDWPALFVPETDSGAVVELAPHQPWENIPAHRKDTVLFVVEGEMWAEVADEHTRMRKGDFLVIPAGFSHRLRNDCAVAARAVAVCAEQ